MLSVDATQVKIVQYKIGEKDFSDCDLGWRDYNPTNNLEEIIKYFRSKLNFFQKSLKCIHCNVHIRFEESWHSAVSSGGIFSFASLWVEKILSFTQIIALPKQLNKSTFSVLVRREIFFLIYKILNFFLLFPGDMIIVCGGIFFKIWVEHIPLLWVYRTVDTSQIYTWTSVFYRNFLLSPPSPQDERWTTMLQRYGQRLLPSWVLCNRNLTQTNQLKLIHIFCTSEKKQFFFPLGLHV